MTTFNMDGRETFPLVTISMERGDAVQIQRGSMVMHDATIELGGKLNSNSTGLGGLLKAAVRSAVSDESLFITTASAKDAGNVVIAAPKPGEIQKLLVGGSQQYYMTDGAFLALSDGVRYTMERQNLGRAIFGGQGGLFIMKTEGHGEVLISGFGSIQEVELTGNEIVIDNAHVVAWDTTLDWQIERVGNSWGKSFTTGEGLVNRFRGTGKVYIQSLNVETFAASLVPFMNDGNRGGQSQGFFDNFMD